jgi:hypothetical protein
LLVLDLEFGLFIAESQKSFFVGHVFYRQFLNRVVVILASLIDVFPETNIFLSSDYKEKLQIVQTLFELFDAELAIQKLSPLVLKLLFQSRFQIK